MRAKRTIRVAGRLFMASSALTAVVWGCGDSDKERKLLGDVAAACTYNSECEGAYICVYERCHEPCKEDDDCLRGELCVRIPDGTETKNSKTIGVCQLPQEAACGPENPCDGPQLCAKDGQCRDSCDATTECVPGLACAASGACAQPEELDTNGELLSSGGMPAGAGGSAGEGGRGGSDDAGEASGGAAVGAGGDPGSAGAPGSEGVAGSAGGTAGALGNGGSGGTSGGTAGRTSTSAGDAGSGGTAMGEGGDGSGVTQFEYFESESGEEPIPNGDRDNVIPMPRTASIYLTKSDSDWFAVETPDDGRAHVIELMIEQEANTRTRVLAYAAADDSAIGNILLAEGVSQPIYISVGPNATTHVVFQSFASLLGRTNVTYSLTAENDDYEPNNDKASAAAIALDTPISAQQIRPVLDEATYADSIADWYVLTLAAGTVTVEVESTPENVGLEFWIYRPDNSTANILRRTRGVIGKSSAFAVEEAGTYHLRVSDSVSTELPAMVAMAKPPHMSEQYRFRVTQP